MEYKERKEYELKRINEKIEVLERYIEETPVSDENFMIKWKELNGLRWDRLTVLDRLSDKNKKQLGMEEYHVPDIVKHNY